MKNGVFTISLDFELHWGGFEKWPLNDGYKKYFLNTRKSIPTLLSLFRQRDIHVTWATVGLLMHKSRKELIAHLPEVQPAYAMQQLSAYHYMEHQSIGKGEQDDPFHFAGALVEEILKVPGQEIGTHTFSHYYCNEPGQNSEEFTADLKAAAGAASKYGIKPVSLVFPRNQFNKEYLKVCAAEGIKIARINPLDWWWQIDSTQKESLWKRFSRGLDAYYAIGGKTSYSLQSIKKQNGVILLPASRLLRPFNPKELFLNKQKIKKIKKEMIEAARNKEVYHLWWHPHNFGYHTQQNMVGLIQIANHFQKLKHEFGMVSLNMGEVARILR